MRSLIVAIAVVLLAGGLAACGGDSDSGTDASTPGATSEDAQVGSSAGGDQQAASDPSEGDAAGEGGRKATSANGSSSDAQAKLKKVKVAPLHVSGGGSKPFVTEGGDNSIQEYGEEASGSELAEAAEALHNYYVAFSKDDWVTACSYLSKSLREGLEQLGSQGKDGAKLSCEEVSASFYANRSSAARHELTIVDAVSLRREGEQAFLIYHGAEYDTGSAYGPSDLYSMSMKQEDGAWKMGLAIGSTMGIPKNLPKSQG
jgi:hypothetical protein